MDTNNLPEAPATAWTDVKSPKGFHWAFTIRDASANELTKKMEIFEEWCETHNYTAEGRRGEFKKESKPTEYVEGKTCPKCGGKLVKKLTKDNKAFYKCENSKWNPTTKTAYGCDYVDWLKPTEPMPVSEYDK